MIAANYSPPRLPLRAGRRPLVASFATAPALSEAEGVGISILIVVLIFELARRQKGSRENVRTIQNLHTLYSKNCSTVSP
jgi:hypothetical protein